MLVRYYNRDEGRQEIVYGQVYMLINAQLIPSLNSPLCPRRVRAVRGTRAMTLTEAFKLV